MDVIDRNSENAPTAISVKDIQGWTERCRFVYKVGSVSPIFYNQIITDSSSKLISHLFLPSTSSKAFKMKFTSTVAAFVALYSGATSAIPIAGGVGSSGQQKGAQPSPYYKREKDAQPTPYYKRDEEAQPSPYYKREKDAQPTPYYKRDEEAQPTPYYKRDEEAQPTPYYKRDEEAQPTPYYKREEDAQPSPYYKRE
ncbi:hypothetical protein F5B18DRAFT_651071 [Nemania serpens]|nr:hypothetical protein F5B18DRAFT_651071 [Nemania serpens]